MDIKIKERDAGRQVQFEARTADLNGGVCGAR